MSDFLVEIGKKDWARNTIKSLGLPLPIPQDLKREKGPWKEQPLAGKDVAVGHLSSGELSEALARILCGAGAKAHVAGSKKQMAAYQQMGEAWGRPVKALGMDAAPEGFKPHALVFDATGAKDPEQLKDMYRFFHSKLRALSVCGRVLVLGRPPETAKDVPSAAAARGLEGFVRAVGKEVGKKGATANLVMVEPGAEGRLAAVAQFFLSYRSTYVSGQPLRVTGQVKAPETVYSVRPLDTRIVLVTGAAQGIGKEIAKNMAAEGARVICMDRPAEEEACTKAAQEIGGTALLCDITDPEAAKKIADHVKSLGGKLSVIVHNAGVTRDKMLVNMDEARWDQAIGINLTAVINTTDKLINSMEKDGRIVCLSSIAGIAGNPGQTNYATSKAGVIGFVQALAPKVAKKGITVNAVAPGFIETQMTAAIPLGTREAGRRLASLGQGGLPEDVAQVVSFLSFPQAVGVTGQVLRICGQNFIGA